MTLRLWPRRSTVIARAASTFSLCLVLLASFAWAQPDDAQVQPNLDPKVARIVSKMPVDSHALADAKRIKASPFYQDDQATQSNWWERAMQSLANWLDNLFKGFKMPEAKNSAAQVFLGTWAIYLMWGLLGAAVLAFVVVVVKHFKWKFKLTRKSKALLEEDEPERTLDEWLQRANELEAEGKYREAVRCLYLACLLRFDEVRIARFDRGQTNWEHLHRIHASPQLPAGLDFEPATKAFDLIWYGMKTRGQADVEMFRGWYQWITDSLKEVKAA